MSDRYGISFKNTLSSILSQVDDQKRNKEFPSAILFRFSSNDLPNLQEQKSELEILLEQWHNLIVSL